MDDNEANYYQHEDHDEEENSSEGEGVTTGFNHGNAGRGGGIGNSSDEDDDDEEEDEDEEEARKIAEGFIVDDDEEQEEDQDSDGSQRVSMRRRKRKKIQEYDEELDEEDLDLLEENTGLKLSRREPKLKRLKRGRQIEPEEEMQEPSVDKFFSDEEAEPVGAAGAEEAPMEEEDTYATHAAYRRQAVYDDINDFIADEDEEEMMEDDERQHDYMHEAPTRRRAAKEMMGILPEGLDEDVLADMYDIFGDGTDYDWALFEEEGEEYTEQPEPKLADVFEPSELKAKMLTEEDDEVRLRDIPERMQIRYAGMRKNFDTTPSDEEIEAEASWVFRELVMIKQLIQPSDSLLEAVKSVIGFITREYLEVPFIADHRRDYFTEMDPVSGITTELLTKDDLWKIYDLDFKYQSFANRKKALREMISRSMINDDYVSKLLDSAERLDDLNDISDYVYYHFAEQINNFQKQSRGPKRPMNKSLYEKSLKSKLGDFLSRFSIQSWQYGANYLENTRRYFPEDEIASPEEEAQNYTSSSGFSDPSRVLRAAKLVLASEVAHDPQTRKAMRRDLDTRAVVSVKPTERGFTIIDELHPLHPFKFLHEKPIGSFQNGEFLQLLQAESDGFLTINVGVANYQGWFEQIAEFYMSDGFSDSVQQWNRHRQDVIRMAVDDHLLPQMEKYIREKLRMESQETICEASYQTLMSKVNVGPFRGRDSDRYKNGIPRVIAVSSGNGDYKDPIMAVCLNHRGRMIDKIEIPTFRDEKSWKQLVDFVKTKRPNVVGVAGFNAQAHHVLKHMQRLISEVNGTLESGTPPIDLVAVDDETSRLYKNSKRAHDEYGEYAEVTRYCISLARRLQCPILEYTSLGSDLLALHFHKFDSLVPAEVRHHYLERALINVVNDMGVDINAAATNPYIASALPHVCGLGPRKAQNILRKIEARGELESRSALVTRGMTPAITFMNCASYLRIRDVDDADILDDTRIHPQEYDLARKMAGDALEIDEDDMDDYDTKVAIVRRVVKEYPKKLNDLILDDYATVLREQYRAPKRQILEHIKLELQGPYHDRRNRYTRPTLEETFTMVTGETPETLREGFIVPVKIQQLRGKMAICLLSNGLEGMLYIDNVSDTRVMSVGDVLEQGSTVNAKVLHIDKEKFVVDMSCKESDTRPDGDLELRRVPNDQYYDLTAEAAEINRRNALLKKKTRVQRTVNHPLFRPFNYSQAEEYLADRQRGDLVIRPSSRGADHIAITWKVDDNMYQHIDVVEVRKDNSAFAPVQYKVNDQIFDDLDQLIVTYVEAIAAKAEELIAHPKYRSGGVQALQSHLSALTMANPRMSAYGFCLSDKPGYFELGFKLNAKSQPARWMVKLLPDGYRLRDTSYPVVSDLINGFKRIQSTEAQKRRQRQQQQQHQHHAPPPSHHHHHHHHHHSGYRR